mmetsp:Transcript_27785/g.31543  ORF Transcript_27785/g.31543 Transcript_27785/m.31543 type:complete len:502 (+) Transcript_27785:45-1550(+)
MVEIIMEKEDLQSAPVADEDAIIDDVADFIDMNDAVEIQVDDDLPMDVDEDNDLSGSDKESKGVSGGDTQTVDIVADMSKIQLTSHTDSVYTVAAFFENGQLSILSGGGDDQAFQYKISLISDIITKKVESLTNQHTDTVSSVAYNMAYISEDMKKTPRLAAVGSYDGSIIIYDPDTGTQRTKLEGPSDVEWISFHPKGGTVLLAGSGDGTLWMFHIPLNRCLQVFVGHEQAVTAGCFSPDGKWALSASSDGSLRIWAPKTGLNKHVFRLGKAGLTCMASKGGTDGRLVIVGSEDGQAHVCHIGSKKLVASLRHYDISTNRLSKINGNTMAAENVEGDEEENIEYPMSVEAVGFSPFQPNWCATGGIDGKLKIWDITNAQCRQVCDPTTINVNGDKPNTDTVIDSITRLMWHPTAPVVFASTINNRVRVWDARNGNLLHTLTGGSTKEQINYMDIQFLPNGSAIIVIAGDDKVVRVFELNINLLTQTQTTTGTAADTDMQS